MLFKNKMSTPSAPTPSTPEIITTAAEMRVWSRRQRLAGKRVGFVPTMVISMKRRAKKFFRLACFSFLPIDRSISFSQPRPPLLSSASNLQGCLHAGHLSLVDLARTKADVVVVSIYVNPTQFAANEDFGRYPRTRERDRSLLAERGVEAVFEPETLYHRSTDSNDDNANVVGTAAEESDDAHDTFVVVERLSRGLCSLSRPHFFRGVATVVAKLFNVVEPDVSVFGEKDWQQLAIVRRMARDLDFAVKVLGGEIVRESDGLALSSRNELLTAGDRRRAPCIYAALKEAKKMVSGSPSVTAGEVAGVVKTRIEAACDGGFSPPPPPPPPKVDYVSVVDADSLSPVPDDVAISSRKGRRTLVAVAAFFGEVRLIDNMVVAG